jgi:hypothetical protein
VTKADNGKEMESIDNCQICSFSKSDAGRETRAAPPDPLQNTSYVTDQALATGYIGPCQTVEQNTRGYHVRGASSSDQPTNGSVQNSENWLDLLERRGFKNQDDHRRTSARSDIAVAFAIWKRSRMYCSTTYVPRKQENRHQKENWS